jgi:hypothetical protein
MYRCFKVLSSFASCTGVNFATICVSYSPSESAALASVSKISTIGLTTPLGVILLASFQTMGRAARNINGHVILYGDRITNSMQRAMDETTRRRKKQQIQ